MRGSFPILIAHSVVPIVGIASVICSAGFTAQATNPAAPAFEWGENGLHSLNYAGHELVAEEGAPFSVRSARFLRGNGEHHTESSTKPEARFAEDNKCVLEYSWGRATCEYKLDGDRLDMIVSLKNATDDTLDAASICLGELTLPGMPTVEIRVDNQSRLAAAILDLPNGRLSLGNWEVSRPVSFSLTGPGNKALLTLDFRSSAPDHPVVDDRHFAVPGRPIPPGATETFHVSLGFAPPGTDFTTMNRQIFEHVRQKRPMKLDWKDRRPIGCLFLANPKTGWKTNPRGYLFGKGSANDVGTEEGLQAFGAGLMEYADRSITSMKAMNAQGVIVWDLEGAEFPHPITYIGHPNMLPQVSPEMHRFADQFMARLRDAGLEVGICIRPTEVYRTESPTEFFRQRDVADPVKLMSEKIAYAKKRWGCRLFYLDSNVFEEDPKKERSATQQDRIPYVMPARMFEALQERHPDVLIMPEWATADYYAHGAPYRTSQIKQYATDPAIRAVYPDAFSVLAADARSLSTYWDNYVQGVQNGDVLLFHGWYEGPERSAVLNIYREAAYRRDGVPSNMKTASLAALVEQSRQGLPAARYYAAEELIRFKQEAVPALVALLEDEDVLVQRNAIRALGKVGSLRNKQALESLMALLTSPNLGEREILRSVAAETLGATGEEAVPGLLDFLAKSKQPQNLRLNAIAALGHTGTTSSEATDRLMALLDDPDIIVRQEASSALGNLRAGQAVDSLIAIVSSPRKREHEDLKLHAVRALGQIGDPRATKPIIDLYREVFSTSAVYRIPSAQQEALEQLTGLKLGGRNEWLKWQGENESQ